MVVQFIMHKEHTIMARVLSFGTEEIDKQRYRFILSAALNGPIPGEDGQAKRRTWDEQRADGKVLRALKTISDEKTSGTGDNEARYRTLKAEGGDVVLTAEQFEKLKSWWTKIQWPVYDIDVIEDTYEWLMSAEDVEKPKSSSKSKS